jgi:WD40 repeat protein/uncharacterized caspase-like protein
VRKLFPVIPIGLLVLLPLLAAEAAEPADAPVVLRQAGHSAAVVAIAISPDRKLVATAGMDNTISLWDIATRTELAKFTAHKAPVTGLAFCEADGTLFSAGVDLTLRRWDVQARREIQKREAEAVFSSLVVTPDCRRVFAGNSHGPAVLWTLPDDRIQYIESLKRVHGLARARASGNLVAWTDEQDAWRFDPITLNVTGIPPGDADLTDKQTVPRAQRKLRAIPNLPFSPDGISSAIETGDSGSIIGLGSGEVFAVSHDGTAGRFGPDLPPVRVAAASVDGSAIVVADLALHAAILSLRGAPRKRSVLPDLAIWSVSKNIERALTYDGTTIEILDLNTTKRERVQSYTVNGRQGLCPPNAGEIVEETFSGDADQLYVGCENGTVFRYAPASNGWAINDSWSTGTEGIDWLLSFALSPDGTQLVLAGINQTANHTQSGPHKRIQFVDLQTKAVVAELRPDIDGFIRQLLFSPSGNRVLAVIDDLMGFDIPNDTKWGLLIDPKTLDVVPLVGDVRVVHSAAFVGHDDDTIVTGSEDGGIRLWCAAQPHQPFIAIGRHTGVVHALTPLGRTERVVSAGEDGQLIFWDVSERKEMCRIVRPADANRLVLRPDGRFDSRNLETLSGINWLFPDDPFTPLPPEIFMRQYFEPSLLQRVLEGSAFPPLPSLASLNRDQPRVDILSVSPNADDDRMVVRVRVTNHGRSGGHDLRLFRDGQLVGYRSGDVLLGHNDATLDFPVRLPRRPGSVVVEWSAYAFNADRVKSATAILQSPYTSHSPKTGRAYVITVGVNAYEDRTYNLSFAANDARRMGDALAEALHRSGSYPEVVPLTLISDHAGRQTTAADATKDNIRAIFDLLAGRPAGAAFRQRFPALASIPAVAPEDLVIVAFSSHGYMDASGRFYLFPYDTGPSIDLPEQSTLMHLISSDELSAWVRDIDAGEFVLIVDSCHSAAAVATGEFKPGPIGSRGLGQLAYDKGMRVLAASQAEDPAWESRKLQHSLLTYALIQRGLKEGRAGDGDGHITLAGWLQYGADEVPQLYADVQNGAIDDKSGTITPVAGALVQIPRSLVQEPQLFDFHRVQREVVLANTN